MLGREYYFGIHVLKEKQKQLNQDIYHLNLLDEVTPIRDVKPNIFIHL